MINQTSFGQYLNPLKGRKRDALFKQNLLKVLTKTNKVGSDNLALFKHRISINFERKWNYIIDINYYLRPNCCVDDDAEVEANKRHIFFIVHKDKVFTSHDSPKTWDFLHAAPVLLSFNLHRLFYIFFVIFTFVPS